MSIKGSTSANQNLSETFRTMTASSYADVLLYTSKTKFSVLANPLLPQIGITRDTKEPIALLDNCCGVGVVRQQLQRTLSQDVLEKSSFVCADISEGMIDLVKTRIAAEDWVNTETKLTDAANTGLPDNSFTHSTIALGLHIVPDPAAVLKETKRILKPGGRFSASTIHRDCAGMFWYADMRDAFASFPFDATFPEKFPLQMNSVGDWASPEWIEGFYREQGLEEVEVQTVSGILPVRDAEEYVTTYAMMLQFVMKTFWSEEMRQQHQEDEVKDLMRAFLEKKYNGKGWEIGFKLIVASGRA